MKRLAIIAAICLSIWSCGSSKMNPDELVNTDFNTKILDGYFVTSIAFDHSGNAWIGTFKQGLIKYNSGIVTIYNQENSVISDTSVIHDIAVDSKNNVWIACEGLIKFDGTRFSVYNSSNTPMPENYVSSVAVDSKDNVWFASSRFRLGGVVKYDGKIWTVYKPENSLLPANFVKSIAIDKNDNVWLALGEIVNHSYLVKISGSNWKVYTNAELGFTPYYPGCIRTDSRNRLCCSIDYSLSSMVTNNGPQLFVFDGKSSGQLLFDNTTDVTVISVDDNDNIWCGISHGFAVYDGEEWIVDNARFPNTSVFAIEQAPDKKTWIGAGDGIYINE